MRKRRDGPRLDLEAGEGAGIAPNVVRQNLDGDVAPEPRVPRPVDLAHPARAERGEDLVGAETGARPQFADLLVNG